MVLTFSLLISQSTVFDILPRLAFAYFTVGYDFIRILIKGPQAEILNSVMFSL